jgi:uncharacterized protein (DUF169 family)
LTRAFRVGCRFFAFGKEAPESGANRRIGHGEYPPFVHSKQFLAKEGIV